MILKRYGKAYHSVEPNFNPAGMTEIGFQRDRAFSMAADEFEEAYERLTEDELRAEAEGAVQREAEQALLRNLEEALAGRLGALGDEQVLVVTNDAGDWPKTREQREMVPEDMHNRFHFRGWIDPPLKVAVCQPRRSGERSGADSADGPDA